MKEIILRPVHWKNILSLITILIFTELGIFLLCKGNNGFSTWCSALFFGICSLVAIFDMLVNIPCLKLSDNGFELNYEGRKYFHEWRKIKFFEIYRRGLTHIVVFNYIKHPPDMELIDEEYTITKSDEIWHDQALPSILGMKPENLATLMNEYLTKAK